MANISDIEIANYALSKVGANPIESFTQNNPNARIVNAAYQKVKRRLLRKFQWNFATRRASLPAHATQTVWGSLNRFPVPSGFLRLIFDNETGQITDWRIESDDTDTLFIVTSDSAPLKIKYVHDVTAPNLYDSMFVEALASLVGAEICEPINGNGSKRNQLRQEARDAILEAKNAGSLEEIPDEIPEGEWLAARR